MTNLVNAVNSTAQRVASVTLSDQGAATSGTVLQVASTAFYRVSYSLLITRAATSSSTATVSFAWTEGSVAQSQSMSAVTGNTTTTQQSDALLIGADAGTAITYAIAYASSGATSMRYGFRMSVEQMP